MPVYGKAGERLGTLRDVRRSAASGESWGELRRARGDVRVVPMAGARYAGGAVRLPLGRNDVAGAAHLDVPHPALAEARATTRRVARTFSLACRVLPRAVRDDVHLLYLVFRTLDDLVDEERPGAAERVDAVATWARGEAGPVTPEVSVLAALERRHVLPHAALGAFCNGMRQDLRRVTFATEADADHYCYQVAGTVGEVMASVLGLRDVGRGLPAAAALGMAMQRTNILRDIDEDAGNGRRYIADEAVDRFGPPLPGRRTALLRDQIRRADALYERGLAGVCELRRGRPAIAAAGAMYREILRQVERDGLGAQAGRSSVAPLRKAVVAVPAAVAAR